MLYIPTATKEQLLAAIKAEPAIMEFIALRGEDEDTMSLETLRETLTEWVNAGDECGDA